MDRKDFNYALFLNHHLDSESLRDASGLSLEELWNPMEIKNQKLSIIVSRLKERFLLEVSEGVGTPGYLGNNEELFQSIDDRGEHPKKEG